MMSLSMLRPCSHLREKLLLARAHVDSLRRRQLALVLVVRVEYNRPDSHHSQTFLLQSLRSIEKLLQLAHSPKVESRKVELVLVVPVQVLV